MSRIVRRRTTRRAPRQGGPRSPWSQALRRALQILLFAGVVTFLFISPYLERAHHLRAISRLDPDEWGPHLNVLCSLDPGQRMLESHLATSPEERRARLIPLLKERGCPERVYTVAIEAPPEAR